MLLHPSEHFVGSVGLGVSNTLIANKRSGPITSSNIFISHKVVVLQRFVFWPPGTAIIRNGKELCGEDYFQVTKKRRLIIARELVTRLRSLRCEAFDDELVFEGCTAAKFASHMTGAKVLESCRKGKQLWLKLSCHPWPSFHMGMSGSPAFRRYSSTSDDQEVLARLN
mmetsp:Transcript_61366/g.164835  ORF Transcript_61366/g.164835 Transcript_61366/m.164835 type:complete len:168 (-) Transcript_61366:201-704(-)